jgi:hypothetical protein
MLNRASLRIFYEYKRKIPIAFGSLMSKQIIATAEVVSLLEVRGINVSFLVEGIFRLHNNICEKKFKHLTLQFQKVSSGSILLQMV